MKSERFWKWDMFAIMGFCLFVLAEITKAQDVYYNPANSVSDSELAILCGYMVANAIEGMDRQQTTEMLRQINEMARTLKNQTRQPYRKDAPTVELTVKNDAVTADGAQIH